MNKLPIVTIQGGLGNQLFQWFFAHEILESSEFRLYLNIPVGPVAQIVYDLGLTPLFNRCEHYKDLVKGDRNLIPRIFDRLWTITFLTPALRLLGYYRENPQPGTRAHKTSPRNVIYANGYFQNWKYAEQQKETIRKELFPILESYYIDVSSRFDLSEPYTVIHVRRGDYRTDQNPETRIGSLDDAFFVEWAKDHPSDRLVLLAEHRRDVEELILQINPSLVLDNTSTSAWETLAIMSFANEILGSNSTLSWWGAWVASQKGAKAFLPSAWDVNGRFNPDDFIFPMCNSIRPVWEVF